MSFSKPFFRGIDPEMDELNYLAWAYGRDEEVFDKLGQEYRSSTVIYVSFKRSFDGLKMRFRTLYSRSLRKREFIKREICAIELLFDEIRLPIKDITRSKPLIEYKLDLFDWDIYLMRKVYNDFIIYGGHDGGDEDDIFSNLHLARWKETMDYTFPFQIESIYPWYTWRKNFSDYLNWIRDYSAEIDKPVIGQEYLRLIFRKYKEYFAGELESSWVSRFYYDKDDEPMLPIKVTEEAREDSSKLILISILSSVHKMPGVPANFDDFVLKRFGLKAFSKAKHDHSKKNTFKRIVKECDQIFRK